MTIERMLNFLFYSMSVTPFAQRGIHPTAVIDDTAVIADDIAKPVVAETL